MKPQRVGTRRLIGLGSVSGIYAAQWAVYLALGNSLDQSVLAAIILPAILILGWLAAGLVIGGFLISRSMGGWRFLVGLICGVGTSAVFIAGALSYLESLPRGYQGP